MYYCSTHLCLFFQLVPFSAPQCEVIESADKRTDFGMKFPLTNHLFHQRHHAIFQVVLIFIALNRVFNTFQQVTKRCLHRYLNHSYICRPSNQCIYVFLQLLSMLQLCRPVCVCVKTSTAHLVMFMGCIPLECPQRAVTLPRLLSGKASTKFFG